jgi:hypothetical protein
MRIFFASIGCLGDDGRPGLWAKNLRDPLIRMGHEVVQSALDWDLPMQHISDPEWKRGGRARMSEQLLEEVRRAHEKKSLDLFLSYFYNVHVEAEAIRQIQTLGIPTVNFYCNGAHQFHLVAEIAPAYDFCWVPEFQAVRYYEAVGANPLHIGMAADPESYHPIPGIRRDIPVIFIGQLYADRAQWLAGLLRRGVPLQIHTRSYTRIVAKGNGCPPPIRRSYVRQAFQDLQKHGPAYLGRRILRMIITRRARQRISAVAKLPPDDEGMLLLFARSHIVLNLSHVYDGGNAGGKVKAHVRLRDFEVPMCRALYFPQYSDELSLYYDIAKEVISWQSLDELVDRIRYYLNHPTEGEKVREAGYRRARRDHTWDQRFRLLFRKIGLPANG